MKSTLTSILLIFIFPTLVKAAACCGGAFAVPSLITGDEAGTLTTSFSYSKVDTDVFADGVWQKRPGDDISQIFKIEGAHIFQDRFQAGVSIPFQIRNLSGAQGGQSSGLGDVSGQLGYEYLPDWDYNPWRPHGVGFLSLNLPTGRSVYESNDGLDSRGRGFWSLGLGTTLTKTWTRWDANSTLEIHRSFEKQVQNSQLEGTIHPGWGGSWAFGTGYNFKDWRCGGSLTWSQEDPISVTGNRSSSGSLQRFTTGTLAVSYVADLEWAGTLNYSDQTLFGDPVNTSLSKSVSILIQRRWAR